MKMLKKEYIILLTIIVALSTYLVLRHQDRTHYRLPKLSTIEEEDISRLEISKPASSILLTKKEDSWYIAPQGYLVDSGKIQNILKVVKELALTAMVSDSGSYNPYGLETEEKIVVRVYSGERIAREFGIGKAAMSQQHTFVKFPDDKCVYHARGNFRRILDQTIEDLRDKAVLSFETDQIREVRIMKNGKSMVFARTVDDLIGVNPDIQNEEKSISGSQQHIWKNSQGKNAETSKMDQLLINLSSLRCDTYMDEHEKDALKEIIYKIDLKGSCDYSLSVFSKMSKDAKSYPAISSENQYPFFLTDAQVKNFMMDPTDIIE